VRGTAPAFKRPSHALSARNRRRHSSRQSRHRRHHRQDHRSRPGQHHVHTALSPRRGMQGLCRQAQARSGAACCYQVWRRVHVTRRVQTRLLAGPRSPRATILSTSCRTYPTTCVIAMTLSNSSGAAILSLDGMHACSCCDICTRHIILCSCAFGMLSRLAHECTSLG
jgi:hypothetical protein